MNGRSGIKVRFDKDFEKQCYDLIKLLGIHFGPADVNIRLKGRWWLIWISPVLHMYSAELLTPSDLQADVNIRLLCREEVRYNEY